MTCFYVGTTFYWYPRIEKLVTGCRIGLLRSLGTFWKELPIRGFEKTRTMFYEERTTDDPVNPNRNVVKLAKRVSQDEPCMLVELAFGSSKDETAYRSLYRSRHNAL